MIGDYHLYSFKDLLLVPIFFFLFRFLIKRYFKNEQDAWYKKSATLYMDIKISASIIFALLLIFVTPGDSQLYFNDALKIKNRIAETGDIGLLFRDFSTLGESFWMGEYDNIGIGLMDAVSNTIPVRIAAFLSFFCFDSFIVLNMFFGVFCGLFLLYPVKQLLQTKERGLALLLYYSFLIPSFVYWSSGIMKDTICIICMSVILNAVFGIYYNQKILKFIPLVLGAYVLYIIKPYIALTFVPMMLMLLYLLFIQKIKSKALAIFALVTVLLTSFIAGINSQAFDDILQENIKSTVALSENFKSQSENLEGAFFSYGEITPSLGGVLAKAPLAITTVFFRPFPWEAKKIITMMSCIEGIMFMLITLVLFFKAGPFRFFKVLFTDPFCVSFLIFILVFALFTGLSTPNFGSLARYKIPCLPFYVLIMLRIAGALPQPPILFKKIFPGAFSHKNTPLA
jgi:hypothetical protein